jgi:low temperature requirement protein LtrA
MARAKPASLLRAHSGVVRVTNIELFFDLVYVDFRLSPPCLQAGG